MKKTTRGAESSSRAHRPPTARRGTSTRAEILSQPQTWRESARQFAAHGTFAQLARTFSASAPWLFVACGSSYYLSRVIAAQWTRLLRVGCTAVPASELLFAPEETFARTGARQIALLSRSGKTTEVLRVAESLHGRAGITTLGVTCSVDSALAQWCTQLVTLPWADEQSMVMTRSFTAILLLFAGLGAHLAEDASLAAALGALPEQAEAWLAANADRIRAFGASRAFGAFVFLGQGAHYWLAQEAALKLTEMSSSYAQAYHTLEFRHGPKSIASPDTLITLLLSDAAAAEESLLVGELRKLRAPTLVIANRATPSLQRESSLLVELRSPEPEFARLAITAIPAQLLGLAVGLRKRLNPDVPRNLTRAVVLNSLDGAAAPRSTP